MGSWAILGRQRERERARGRKCKLPSSYFKRCAGAAFAAARATSRLIIVVVVVVVVEGQISFPDIKSVLGRRFERENESAAMMAADSLDRVDRGDFLSKSESERVGGARSKQTQRQRAPLALVSKRPFHFVEFADS